MSEQAPRANKETTQILPRDETIDTIRNEISGIKSVLDEATQKVETPGFKASANDILDARRHLRDLQDVQAPRLQELQDQWTSAGGEKIEEAEQAVAQLNFRSDASERLAAQTALRDAKNNFYDQFTQGVRDEAEAMNRKFDANEQSKTTIDTPRSLPLIDKLPRQRGVRARKIARATLSFFMRDKSPRGGYTNDPRPFSSIFTDRRQ